MASSYVLKFPVADASGAAILLHVVPKGGNGLDLDLLATDGDAAFRGKEVRTRHLDKFRAKNYDGSSEEWHSILKYGLVSRQSDLDRAVRDNLDIACSITGKDPKSTLSISFRTRVQDITQRLGSIELPQTEDTEDVDLFGWASQLASRRDELEDRAAKQEHLAGAEAKTIQTLQNQLDELTKAKSDHEDELISKFALLLNEKKLKIRKLKRVLETTKVDPEKVDEIENLLSPAVKRGKKRGARRASQAPESDESDGFDDMDLDRPVGARQDGDQDARSQATSDTEDADTENDNDLDQPIMSQTESGSAGASKPQTRAQAPQSIPARRELPFTKQSKGTRSGESKGSSSKTQTAVEDEETASEDDEL
ncbi:uncharacterized protein HMPREF1541_01601 [Cyphellophora europaea CBS 101466]|uniref:XRCC4 coiled-coil domain-containing protein n=1 Tax=Cyphellophora europaea (strain CBS 101466) TaxID=1220924 RepID=W2S166_CYPE1|nr:uncharacterized protein HMPREF1541_01601 [Cyphellophora europaea CBS 101466]ETN42446.1 hypothetical protein HMPREF1541_01601 [Cyphellophora europaea CBS 101466]